LQAFILCGFLLFKALLTFGYCYPPVWFCNYQYYLFN